MTQRARPILITSVPKNFPAAVVLVQRTPAKFTLQCSLHHAEVATMRVKEAEGNEAMCRGTSYVCPGSHHLRISLTGRLKLDDDPRISGYRPCADVTFESAAGYAGATVVALILPGM